MDKRQKLRFNTPDNSFAHKVKHIDLDMQQDSTIIIPKRLDRYEVSDQINSNFEPSNFESSTVNDSDNLVQESHKTRESKEESTFSKYKNTIVYTFLIFSTFYYAIRSNNYTSLLEEVAVLQAKAKIKLITNKIENIACLSFGTIIGEHSDLYKYGILMSKVTDSSAILEAGDSKLAFNLQSGFFNIHLRPNHKLLKIAFYHPENANPSSAIKDFTILINDNEYAFTFCGLGYQEFCFKSQEATAMRIIFSSNHGDIRYTCLYRIFIFAE